MLVGGPDVQVLETTELPTPPRVRDGNAYLLGPMDKISVSIFGLPDLDKKEIQVDAGGYISVPLAGAVEAGGKSSAELASIIQDRLRKYVRDPQVSVNVTDTLSNVITVDGQVREPGLYPVIGEMSLMRAIAAAKGATEFARLREVVIFRKVGDQQYAALYNLDAIRKGTYRDPLIYANDVVVVGDSPARRLFKDLLQITPLITTPLVTLIAYRR